MKERIKELAHFIYEAQDGQDAEAAIEFALATLYNEALEKAASECGKRANSWKTRQVPLHGYAAEIDECAAAIRKLKV